MPIVETLEEAIIRRVTELQGCKITSLVVDLTDQFSDEIRQVSEIVDRLIAEKKLVEVEYVLPALSYRAKSFLLPAGSSVCVFGARFE